MARKSRIGDADRREVVIVAIQIARSAGSNSKLFVSFASFVVEIIPCDICSITHSATPRLGGSFDESRWIIAETSLLKPGLGRRR